jgi:Mrp family chromosome partitioning ATPase
MLRSSMLETVFDDLSSKFDHVVVDVPPILAGSNSLALMRHVPAYILVVRHGTTKVDQVASAVAQLSTHESLGVVLNEFSTKVPKGLRRFFTA